MAIFGTLPTVRAQAQSLPWLAVAFAYLEELFTPGSEAHAKLSALAAGETFRRELAGGTFALEQVYHTKPRAQGVYETHRKYVDVQVLLAGEECMEIMARDTLTVREPYNPDRDAIFYHPTDLGSLLRFRAGDTAIFFPEDAHCSALQAAGPALVRKAVLKVPLPGAWAAAK